MGSQKCNRCVGAKNTLAVTGLPTTRIRLSPYLVDTGIMGKLGATYVQVNVFAVGEFEIKMKKRVWGAKKCNRCVGAENTHAVTILQPPRVCLSPYLVENGI